MEKHGRKYRERKMIDGKTYFLTFDNKPSKAEIAYALARKCSNPCDSSATFGDCLNDYITNNDSVLSPTTIHEKKALFRKLPQNFLNKRISSFTEQYVQEFINNFNKELSPTTGKKRSPKTVSNLWGDISVILRKYGKYNFSINLPQKKPDDSYFPSEEDVMEIRYYIKGTPLEIPYLIAMTAGLREGEICGLTVDDVQNDMIHVNKAMYRDQENKKWVIKDNPKTSKSNRYVPIPHSLQEMIHKQGYIYKYSPNRLLKQLHKAQDDLDIPRFRFHTLRAYYTSIAHEMGVPDQYIMKNTGHQCLSTLHRHYEKALKDKQGKHDAVIVEHFNLLV